MRDAPRPYRIFLSGNCQMQFVFDALNRLYHDEPDILLAYGAAYRPVQPEDEATARRCDVYIEQVTNLAGDSWSAVVPASARRIRVPALALPGVFHTFAPRIHQNHVQRGRQPYYLARGNRVLEALEARFRRGEAAERLVADYLAYRGGEIETAPRLLEMNLLSMRRIGLAADFDAWRAIEPHLNQQRFFWSAKHPTLGLAMMLLHGVLDLLGLPWNPAVLDSIAAGPEYHEPYHAPVHPRLAERLDLAWAGETTRYRFFQRYFTAKEHAERYIAGDFKAEFALNKAIRDARTRADAEATAALFRSCRTHFPGHGQADLWYGRVLHRLGRKGPAAFYYRRALEGATHSPHAVAHRSDVPAATIATWLRRCQKDAARRLAEPADLAPQVARLQVQEARLLAQIRRLKALRRLEALRRLAALREPGNEFA